MASIMKVDFHLSSVKTIATWVENTTSYIRALKYIGGGYFLAARTTTLDGGDDTYVVWLIKLGQNDNEIKWIKSLRTISETRPIGLTFDGRFVYTCYDTDLYKTIFMAKYDLEGTLINTWNIYSISNTCGAFDYDGRYFYQIPHGSTSLNVLSLDAGYPVKIRSESLGTTHYGDIHIGNRYNNHGRRIMMFLSDYIFGFRYVNWLDRNGTIMRSAVNTGGYSITTDGRYIYIGK